MGYIQRQTWKFFHFFPLILILLWVLFLPYRRSYQYFRIIWFSRCFGYYRKTPLIVLINSNLIRNFKYDPIPPAQWIGMGRECGLLLYSFSPFLSFEGRVPCLYLVNACISFFCIFWVIWIHTRKGRKKGKCFLVTQSFFCS